MHVVKVREGHNMQVSRVNVNSFGFGRIRKSAVSLAIKDADGDIKKLDEIKKEIEGQKNSRYDILGGEPLRYKVVNPNTERLYPENFDKLSDACRYAEAMEEQDALEAKKEQDRPKFEQLAQELLDSCEE